MNLLLAHGLKKHNRTEICWVWTDSYRDILLPVLKKRWDESGGTVSSCSGSAKTINFGFIFNFRLVVEDYHRRLISVPIIVYALVYRKKWMALSTAVHAFEANNAPSLSMVSMAFSKKEEWVWTFVTGPRMVERCDKEKVEKKNGCQSYYRHNPVLR